MHVLTNEVPETCYQPGRALAPGSDQGHAFAMNLKCQLNVKFQDLS